MQSDAYKTQRLRNSLDRDADTVAHQRRLKVKCWRLRDQCRQARRNANAISAGKLSEGDLSWSRWELLKQYRSNELTLKLDAATTEDGFGDLRLQGRALLAPSFA